jgi:DNA ligase-1
VQLADVLATSQALSGTRSKTAKVRALADLLRRTPRQEVAIVVGFLVGALRQGRVGVGWGVLRRTTELASAEVSSLTVGDVDDAVSRLADLSGPGSARRREELLEELFGRATAPEADFLRRLLLGELRHGALQGVMADAVAEAARLDAADVRRAAMLAGDLGLVAAAALGEGADGLAGIGLEVLRPVLPMLAATAGSVAEALEANGRSSVEWKLDGARIQAHRRGDTVRLFTRNLNDVTDRLPFVAAVVGALAVEAVILDGEVFGAGAEDEVELFQDTMRSFSRHDPAAEGSLQVRFFDVLHLDGVDLIDRPLEERIGLLGALAGAHRIPGIVTADRAEAEAFADDALARGLEGVMVKAASSRYDAGRRGSAWRKVKPVRTFDLVVLGAEWGHGRRRGWLSNLHLGARDPATDGFVMVGKTFKGLTDALLGWQTEELLERETRRDGITVFVRPELVVEIAVDGVQRSPRYRGGVALRFARVRRYRPDKSAGEADTIDAVRSLLAG